jgi:hypothetical protein
MAKTSRICASAKFRSNKRTVLSSLASIRRQISLGSEIRLCLDGICETKSMHVLSLTAAVEGPGSQFVYGPSTVSVFLSVGLRLDYHRLATSVI